MPITLAFVVDVSSTLFGQVKRQIQKIVYAMEPGDRCYWYQSDTTSSHERYGAASVVSMVRRGRVDIGKGVIHSIEALEKLELENQLEKMMFIILDQPSIINVGSIRFATAESKRRHLDIRYVVCTIGEEANEELEQIAATTPQLTYCNVVNTNELALKLADQMQKFDTAGYEYFKICIALEPHPDLSKPPLDVLESSATSEFTTEE